MGRVDKLNVDYVFAYHGASEEEKLAYAKINDAAQHLAVVILDVTPACADQTTAIRCVREARMWANAAIALKGDI